KVRFSLDILQAFCRIDAFTTSGPKRLDNILAPREDLCHIDRDFAGVDAIVVTSSSKVSHAAGGDHCLGRCTSPVHTSATRIFTFHQGGLASGVRECAGERSSALARANDDYVEVFTAHKDVPYPDDGHSARFRSVVCISHAKCNGTK